MIFNTDNFSIAGNHKSPVWASDEWGTLEEVIVGRADGACWPPTEPAVLGCVPDHSHEAFSTQGGKPVEPWLLHKAEEELDGFARLLESEGVKVRRPDQHAHSNSFSTPNWDSPSGLYAAMPRDVALVLGDTIIEAPMAWRCRYFEIEAFRTLFKEYFAGGAKWIAAPRPVLHDDLYHQQYEPNFDGIYAVTEFEPTFDAADFIRFGFDVIGQRSNVTNNMGIEWLRRHLPPGYRLTIIDVVDDKPMHIDATLIPLAPGKLMVNPERLPVIPDIFADWEVRQAPHPTANPVGPTLQMSSGWISMNVLSIDEKRVVVEAQETELMAFMKSWGIEPIPCAFRHFQTLGGSFHCATLDMRRKSEPQSLLKF